MKISVCMAAYNGSRFIELQINSVLQQLGPDDEIIVVDDASKDNTIALLKSITDPRIKIFKNTSNLGVVKSFEKAISHSTHDIIFFCDQDDVWRFDKVQRMVDVFKSDSKITMVISNAEIIDDSGKSESKLFFKKFRSSFLSNLAVNNFLGCAIAFKKNAVTSVFPFPNNLPMHDSWVGLNHVIYGKIYYIDEPLFYYRRHDSNVTTGKRSSIINIVKWRVSLLMNLLKTKSN